MISSFFLFLVEHCLPRQWQSKTCRNWWWDQTQTLFREAYGSRSLLRPSWRWMEGNKFNFRLLISSMLNANVNPSGPKSKHSFNNGVQAGNFCRKRKNNLFFALCYHMDSLKIANNISELFFEVITPSFGSKLFFPNFISHLIFHSKFWKCHFEDI